MSEPPSAGGGAAAPTGRTPDPGREPMPPGIRYAYGFALTNALSFNLTLGAPMILFAKTLGAGPAVLGFIGALTPLLTVLQVPAARFIPRYGYRRFMLMGWSARTVFIFLTALLPVASALDASARLRLLLVFLFCFNLLRGISSGAWLPWITEVVPEAQRSRYLSTDGILLHLGGFCSLLLAGLFLGAETAPWKFSAVFLFSALAATASLECIRRIPEAPAAETSRRSGQPVPWRAIVFYPPFFKLVVFNLVFTVLAGSFGVFAVSWLRGNAGMAEGQILLLLSAGFLSAIGFYPVVRWRLDRLGSRRLLRFALLMMAGLLAVWTACAAGLLPAAPWLIAAVYFLWGAASAHFNLAGARLMMGTMPEMGRTHFYAFFSTIVSLGFGVSPILWGVALDLLGGWSARIGPALADRYTLFFACLIGVALLAALLVSWLEEAAPPAPSTGQKAAQVDAGLRRLGRLLHR